MNRTEQTAALIQQFAFLEKVAQTGSFSQGMADVAQPLLYGLGGYGLSRMLGGGEATGIPDWLLGPAAGIGLGMPLVSGIRQGIGGMFNRRKQQQQMAQQQAEIEAAMQQDAAMQAQMQSQSQQMLQQLALQQAGLPAEAMGGVGMPPGMTVTGSLLKKAVTSGQMAAEARSASRGSNIGAGTGAMLGAALGMIATKGKGLGKAERALSVLGGTGGGVYVGKTIGELLGPNVAQLHHKHSALKPRPETSLRIPTEQADQVAQQAGQRVQQQMQEQQRVQMQQAATAQLIKGQFRGLQDRQRSVMKQVNR